jgi:hypothetical protein
MRKGGLPPSALHDGTLEFTPGLSSHDGVAQNLAAAGLFATPEVTSHPSGAVTGVQARGGTPAWAPGTGTGGPGTAAAVFNAALAAEVRVEVCCRRLARKLVYRCHA